MIKVNLMNNTKTRRKGSMLQDSFSKIKYFLVLSVLLVLPVLPMQATAQPIPLLVDQTDTGVNRLVAPWDLRSRHSFIQVTNTSSSRVNIHVQIFDVDSPFTTCEECNFDDTLTAFDTHVYDMEDLITNLQGDEVCTDRPGSYGFMVISVDGIYNNQLIGMFRIIDDAGYEYRANAAGSEDRFAALTFDEVVNFSDANGHSLSDLIGITYVSTGPDEVYASPGVQTQFGSALGQEVLIYDEDEDDISCSPTTFACAPLLFDKGIDNALPNSKGEANRVCSTSILDSNTSGWLHLPLAAFICSDPLVGDANNICLREPFFVGFIGLNNGDGTGSMDSWWETNTF